MREVDGWRERGSASFNPRGVVNHHTAGPSSGEIPELQILIKGRPDLPGPLCNVGLGRSGTCYIVAAGRANHAGSGGWRGLRGNSSVLGIEAANDGRQSWPLEQLRAYVRLAAALITGPGVGSDVENVCAHREWTPRKPDPHSIDMGQFRSQVREILAGEEDDMTPAEMRAELKPELDAIARADKVLTGDANLVEKVAGLRGEVDKVVVDVAAIKKRLSEGAAPGGVTEADIRRIVKDELKAMGGRISTG